MYVLRWIRPNRGNSAFASAGIHREDALLGVREARLEADEVVRREVRVLGAQLHHGPRPVPGARVLQPDRAHRPEAQRLRAHHAITSIGMQLSK